MTAKSPKTAPVANQNLTIKWKPPDADCYKVNFEEATIQDIHCAGLGVVIRDHHGHLVAVLSQKIPLPNLTKTVEALAAWHAAQLVLNIGLDQVELEGDAAIIIKELQAEDSSITIYGHIIEDTKRLTSMLQNFSFSHTRRQEKFSCPCRQELLLPNMCGLILCHLIIWMYFLWFMI